MRRLVFIFITILLCLFLYITMDGVSDGHTVEVVGKEEGDPSLPFMQGEELTYALRYKNVNVGESTLTFHGEKDLDNRKVYNISFFTRMMALTDLEMLYADKSTFLPLEVDRIIKRFGAFTTKIKERYDQDSFKVNIKQKSRFRSRELTIEKDSPIHNAILLTYYYRTQTHFDKTKSFNIVLPTAEFDISFQGIETIQTPMGKYEAYSFSSNPSRFKFWLSRDKRKIPLKIENPTNLEYSLVIKDMGGEKLLTE